MLFFWFDAHIAIEFGLAMAHLFIERMPPDMELSEKQFAVKSQKVLNSMNHQISGFKQINKLNIYKKAQMGNAFKWALKDAGYDERYINHLTEWFVSRFQ